jgi:hypothetical protein
VIGPLLLWPQQPSQVCRCEWTRPAES